ncbi:hypothetical protein [Gryllotalpicola sp.]|uniref:hypothetical protein n=1 Tax=Gryllotalpicola sp. TaxID=1932787 RepID=UPI0026117929|nr:hypothetical protein [Gryllotalpicola sp.]
MSAFWHLAALLADTPVPSPSATVPNPDSVTPGPWGFIAIAAVGIATGLLIWDMTRRVRRVRYRAEVKTKLDAEELAAREAEFRGPASSASATPEPKDPDQHDG